MKPVKLTIAELDTESYHVFLTIYIEGFKCRFLLDTGASRTVIDKGFVLKKFGAKKVKTIQRETSGLHSVVNETSLITINTMKIGVHDIKEHLFAAVDLSHVNNTYKKVNKPRIHGILGSDILLIFGAVIDYANKKMTLTPPVYKKSKKKQRSN